MLDNPTQSKHFLKLSNSFFIHKKIDFNIALMYDNNSSPCWSSQKKLFFAIHRWCNSICMTFQLLLGLNELIKGKMQRLAEGSGWGCMDCEYTTAFQTNLFSHIETHHCSGVAYTCPQCYSAHPSKNSLRMHIRRKHNTPQKASQLAFQSWLYQINYIGMPSYEKKLSFYEKVS